MVILETSDNEKFTVDKDVAERSILIKQMLDGEYCSERSDLSSRVFRIKTQPRERAAAPVS